MGSSPCEPQRHETIMKEVKKGIRRSIALLPIAVLVAFLSLDIAIFGADSILGPSQVALLTASAVCVCLAILVYKTKWKAFEEAIGENMGNVSGSLIILLFIGAISGTWTMSGIVPALICYGLKIISPKVFLLTACAICAVVSLLTGSSWTTIATIGVALIGIGRAEGFNDAMTAGAIISGAYFGDKISPLSDTTLLASSVNKVELFTHIRYMLITTGPSIVITLIIFTVIGLVHPVSGQAEMMAYSDVLKQHFNITPWLLVVPVLTGVMIWRKFPAIIVLALSALAGAIAALIFQPDIIYTIGSAATEGSRGKIMFTGIVECLYNTVTLDTGNPEVSALVTSRGMVGMLNTVFLIICAMCFGGCMKASGMIDDIAGMLTPLTRSRTKLVGTTVATGTVLNGIVSDQYLAVILTSNFYRESFEKGGYEGRLLSRSVEDSATVTSPLFPWSSCGMTQATILSVPTLAYAPFCFFNLISPLMSILIAAIGWKIVKRTTT